MFVMTVCDVRHLNVVIDLVFKRVQTNLFNIQANTVVFIISPTAP